MQASECTLSIHLYRATYPVLRAATGVLRSVPIVGLLPETALSMLQYLNRTHFYNANSS